MKKTFSMLIITFIKPVDPFENLNFKFHFVALSENQCYKDECSPRIIFNSCLI